MALLPSMVISLMLGRSATTTTSTLPSRPMRISSKLPVANRLRAVAAQSRGGRRVADGDGHGGKHGAGGDALQALDPDIGHHERLGRRAVTSCGHAQPGNTRSAKEHTDQGNRSATGARQELLTDSMFFAQSIKHRTLPRPAPSSRHA
jgi:hypothetical protein